MKLFVIGSGNVANSLGSAFKKAGHEITGVFGRNPLTSARLAKKLNTKAFNDINKIPIGSDIYLLAIKDDAINEIAHILKKTKGIVVHTSGTTSISTLSRFNNHGVFYPVETIKTNFPLSYKKVPICLEASNEPTLKKLLELAGSISNEIYLLDSNQRAQLHLAAVFTNNFNNYLLGISIDILKNCLLPKELLKELAYSTVRNAFSLGSYQSQTGPALRNDKITMQKHLNMLKKDKTRLGIYNFLTKKIINVHKKHKK